MSTTISFQKIELTQSPQLGTTAYRVEFSLSDSIGQYGPVPVLMAREPRSRLTGTVIVDLPLDQAGEADVFIKAREVLHDALTRLAAAAAGPAPR